jgi:hypothetical protein
LLSNEEDKIYIHFNISNSFLHSAMFLYTNQLHLELLGFWTLSIVQYSRKYQTMDKVQKYINSECNIPSSEPFRNQWHLTVNENDIAF